MNYAYITKWNIWQKETKPAVSVKRYNFVDASDTTGTDLTYNWLKKQADESTNVRQH